MIRSLYAAALLLCLIPSGGRGSIQANGPALPDDLQAFISRAQDALKAGDRNALDALAQEPHTFDWLGQRSFRNDLNWNIAVLTLPSDRGPGTAYRGGRRTADGGPTESVRHPSSVIRLPSPYLADFYDFHTCESIGDHLIGLVKTADGWKLGAEVPERETLGYRVRDHNLSVRYDLPNHACQITDDVTVERTGGEGPCLLRLSSDMQVDRLTMAHGSPTWTHAPGFIAVVLPAGKSFMLHLRYHGTVNHPGSDYIRPTEAVLCSYWYPHVARLPAKQTVTSTVPKGWLADSEGELLKRTDGPEDSTFTYRNTVPTCYFTLDAGPYRVTSRVANGRKLSVYELKHPSDQRVTNTLDVLEKSLAFYDSSFGRMPYTHYEVLETLGPFGGALEAYSFSTYNTGLFPGAVPHEVAHTWWGGIVPCTYTRTMWNESFASYSDGLFRRQTSDPKPAKALSGQHQDPQHGRNLIRGYAVPISEAYDTSSGPQGTVGYGKGSLVLDMLEDTLGTETMVRCMRRFYDDHKAGEAADWPDFERAVNAVTGQDYGWFFSQWLTRGGVPIVKLENIRKDQRGGDWMVTGEIVQEGTPYRLRIPVEVDAASSGSQESLVDVSAERTPFQIMEKSEPTAVKLDPAGNVLLAGGTVPEGQDPLVFRFTP